MFIKSMRLINTITDRAIREVLFHKGVNLIVDTEGSSLHNKVGKTTFLKLIDIAMGAKDRKHLYTDADTGAVTEELRAFIESNRIAVELVLATSLDHVADSEDTKLCVSLFPNGHYFIDGERISQKNYQKELNLLLFANEENIPTFRQLINSFVRVSVAGDDDSFLKNLTSTSTATYRGIYNYLFGISNPALDKKLDNLNKDLSKAKDAEKRYKSVNNVDTIGEQEQILAGLDLEYEQVQTLIDNIIDADTYKANREAIAETRSEYAALTMQLSDIDYRLQRNLDALKIAEQERSRQADVDLSQRFFEEVHKLIPSISATFEEMIEFNSRLCDNKVAYFESVTEKIEDEKKLVSKKLTKLADSNSKFMSLVEQDRIDDYEHLQTRILELSQRIGRCNEIIETLNNYAAEKTRIETSIDAITHKEKGGMDDNNSYQSRMTAFNAFFTPLAQRVNNESPLLVYYPEKNKFPVAIRDLTGSSTGTRKSLIAAYDLAYQQFAEAEGIGTPRFVVHDVLENIEGAVLKIIIEQANAIHSQYIVAILKEKLDSSGIDKTEQEELTILQLSMDSKLFTKGLSS